MWEMCHPGGLEGPWFLFCAQMLSWVPWHALPLLWISCSFYTIVKPPKHSFISSRSRSSKLSEYYQIQKEREIPLLFGGTSGEPDVCHLLQYSNACLQKLEYWTNMEWVVAVQRAGHGPSKMSGLCQQLYLQKCRIPRSASLQSAGGITLQNLTPGPGCGSFSDHPAPFPVQEQSNVFTHS